MAKLIDLTGQRFGKLVVIERDFEYPIAKNLKHKTSAYWKCQCDCGNIKTIIGDSLRNGQNKSCGCAKKSDLTNQRFGKLIALYPTEKRNNQRLVVWHCKCDCGKEIDVSLSCLINNSTKSCGCLVKQDLTNQRFGKLIALYPTEKRQNHRVVWSCRCDCGNMCEANTSDLLSGGKASCGCLTSLGEQNIQKVLQKNNINFEKEYSFSDFIYEDTKYYPRYDFYLPDYNRLIEFDGKQHIIKQKNSSWDKDGKFEKRQEHDLLKNEYAKQHNIDLVRIPHFERDNITLEILLGDKYLIT